MTASVGIAFSGRGDQLSEQLLQDADAAMYQAKRKGGARHQIIDLREQHLADERAGLERDLRGAPARGELRTEYQPIVDTSDGRITGVEALVRWAHPSRGLVMPTVLDTDRRAVRPHHRDRTVGPRAGVPRPSPLAAPPQTDDLTMSVNVSRPATHVARLRGDRRRRALPRPAPIPQLVTLEVTESVFVQDSQRALVVLDELKHIGVKLALDDFGTGYSSLNYLKRFPIDIVKIDQGFVADLEGDPASHAIVFSVIELAHRLGMTVVAEGVETAEQHQQLARARL